jgi:hypothetical protein
MLILDGSFISAVNRTKRQPKPTTTSLGKTPMIIFLTMKTTLAKKEKIQTWKREKHKCSLVSRPKVCLAGLEALIKYISFPDGIVQKFYCIFFAESEPLR